MMNTTKKLIKETRDNFFRQASMETSRISRKKLLRLNYYFELDLLLTFFGLINKTNDKIIINLVSL